MQLFTCQCGFETDNSQSYNGHRGHCAIYLGRDKYLSLRKIHEQNAKSTTLTLNKERWDAYNSAPNHCKFCGTALDYDKRLNAFCNNSCAASYNNIHRKVTRKTPSSHVNLPFKCEICGAPFSSQNGLNIHIGQSHKEYVMGLPYVVIGTKYFDDGHREKDPVELDITRQEMEDYKMTHKSCEICGRNIDDVGSNGKTFTFAVDHEPGTTHFRGLLCITCNTKLGWYEAHSDAIALYLTRNTSSNTTNT